MGNSLASGALVLSIDSDTSKLNAGLDKAAKQAKQSGEKIGKDFTSSASSAFKFGAFASLGAKAVEGIGKGLEVLVTKAGEFKEKIAAGTMVVNSDQSKGVNSASNAIERLGKSFDDILVNVLTALAPTLQMIAETVEEWLPRLTPVLTWMGKALETVWSIGTELFEAFTTGVGDILRALDAWIGKTFGLGDTWATIEGVILGILRVIGKVGAYAFDTIAAAMGVVAVGVGLLIRGFGNLIDLFRRVVSLAKELPSALRPAGLDNFIAAVENTSAAVLHSGHEVQNWGTKQITTFGDSAKNVDKFIDGIANRARGRVDRAKADAKEIEKLANFEYKPNTLVQAGSKELASIKAKFTTEGLFNPKLEMERKQLAEMKHQLNEQKKINKNLEKWGLDKWSLM